MSLIEFENMLRVDLCASENTIKAYLSDIKQFILWKKKSDRKIQNKILYQYIEELATRLKNSSINRKLTSILSWIKFREKEYEQKFVLEIPKIIKEKNIPKTISNQNFQDIKNSISECKLGLRKLSIIQALYSTGMRVSEMIKVKFNDIKPVLSGYSRSITINGKGNKDRLVFITEDLKKILEKYCCIYKIKSGYLWPTGKSHITRQAVHYIISNLGKKLGIRVSPHSLRHRLAVNLVQNGMELVAIQKILGHSHINTTAIYTEIEDDLIHRIVEQYHPLGIKLNINV